MRFATNRRRFIGDDKNINFVVMILFI